MLPFAKNPCVKLTKKSLVKYGKQGKQPWPTDPFYSSSVSLESYFLVSLFCLSSYPPFFLLSIFFFVFFFRPFPSPLFYFNLFWLFFIFQLKKTYNIFVFELARISFYTNVKTKKVSFPYCFAFFFFFFRFRPHTRFCWRKIPRHRKVYSVFATSFFIR